MHSSPAPSDHFLSIENLSFRYGAQSDACFDFDDLPAQPAESADALEGSEGKACIEDIMLKLPRGSVLLLTGASGCGKTTLMRCLNGLVPEFFSGELEGSVRLDGEDILVLPPDLRGRLVGSVFQNPRSQFFNVIADDEIRFGCENLNLEPEEIERRVSELNTRMGVTPYLHRSLFSLSGGEKQRIACLCVAAMHPKLMLFDEPSSNLDLEGMRSLADMMERLKKAGVTQIISEHRLAYMAHLLDAAVIMEDGRIKEHFTGDAFRALSPAELTARGLRCTAAVHEPPARFELHLRGGSRSQVERSPNGSENANISHNTRENEGFYITSLQMRYKKEKTRILDLRDVSFERGRVHVLVGTNGIGKSSLLRALTGLEDGVRGRILYEGRSLRPSQFRRCCAMLFQDPNHQLMCASVREELELSLAQSSYSREEGRARMHELLSRLSLDGTLERHPFSLSGGQKQRLALISALLMNRPVLLLDEPTSGLDLKHMQLFSRLIREIARDKTVLLVTHDRELIDSLDPVIHHCC